MKLLDRVIRRRVVQLLVWTPDWRAVVCGDYTLPEWWDANVRCRQRGFYPRSSPWWPIFHYWRLAVLELRVFSAETSKHLIEDGHA